MIERIKSLRFGVVLKQLSTSTMFNPGHCDNCIRQRLEEDRKRRRVGRRRTNKLPAHQTNFREELEKCCGQAPAMILEGPSDPLIFNLAFKFKLIRKTDENEMKRKEKK